MRASSLAQLQQGLFEGLNGAGYWQQACDTAAAMISPETACSIMIRLNGREPLIHAISSNRSPGILEEYRAGYMARDPRLANASVRPGLLNHGVAIMHEIDFDRTAIANEYLNRPDVGARHSLTRYSRTDCGVEIYLGFHRAVEKGRIPDAELPHIEGVSLHLEYAARLQARLLGLENHVSRLSATLELLADPIIVVDRECRIQMENTAAVAALRSSAVVKVSGGTLRIERSADQRRLEAAIRLTSEFAEGRSRPALPLVLHDNDGEGPQRLLIMRFLPLRRGHDLAAQAEVLITLSPRAASPNSLLGVFSALGCSRAEADTAMALAEGLSLAEIADMRTVSLETIRTQVKSVIRKTGCSGQRGFMRFIREIG